MNVSAPPPATPDTAMSSAATSGAGTPPDLAELLRGVRGVSIGLLLGLLVLGVLFQTEVAAAVQTWIVSTAYNHCFLVIPIVGYMIWDRRAELRGLTARPAPLLALGGIPIAAGWLVAERLGIMEGRQLMAVSFVELLFLTLLGWQSFRAIVGPLLYLYFLVPFGEFLVPRLQDITADFTRYGLQVLAIPAYIDGYTIEIAAGTFYVAEACAGLRFLIASIAFGCLYALLMYRSPVRRAAFILTSIVVPVIANGFRALGIVVLGHYLGSAEAAAADHVLYGWIFFSLVILLLIALGLPFREDYAATSAASAREMAPGTGPNPARAGVAAALIVVIIAAVSPALSLALDRANTVPVAEIPLLDLGAGCTSARGPASAVTTPGLHSAQLVTCGGPTFLIRIEIFSRQTTAGPVVAERRRLSRLPDFEDAAESWLTSADGQESRVWRVIRTSHPVAAVAVAMWVDGVAQRPGLKLRLRMARSSLTGASAAPVVASVGPAVDWPKLSPDEQRRAAASLITFMLAHPNLDAAIGAIATHP